MSRIVRVVVVRSLSFTGTTWLNLVLGSHPRAFTLGPPDRVMNLPPDAAADACRVHGERCAFWTDFFRQRHADANFFVQLAEFADRDVIVINNPLPHGAAQALDHPQIETRPIHMIRDGRAIAASYRRKYPDTPFLDAVRDWLHPSYSTFDYDDADPDRLCLRYESLLADQRAWLPRLAAHVGLDYDESALRFWEHTHHITAGNAGTIAMVRLHEGQTLPDSENRAFYAAQLERLRDDPTTTFADDRWADELSRRERFVFDHLCGDASARFGYQRDTFTLDEVDTFRRELARADGTPDPTPDRPGPSPAAPRAAPLAPIGADTPGLRTQLRPAHLLTRGLHIEPRQVRLLILALVSIITALLVLVAALTALVIR